MLRYPRFLLHWAFTLGFWVALTPNAGAEEFVLQVPGRNDLTSSANVSEQQLVITDSQNQTFIYKRMPQLDTGDGQYWGFYSQAAGQTIRWPANHAGSMLIGSANGQDWRQSQQQIQAARPNVPGVPNQPNVVTTRRPAYDRPNQNLPAGNLDAPQKKYTGPMEVAYTPAGNQALDVGYIGPQGDLQLYRGFRDQWQPHQVANDQLRQQAGLLPGAPLRLVSRQGQELPSAYTVNRGGQLVEIQNGNEIRPVADNLEFAPRSHLNIRSSDRGPEGFAVDAQGRLWDLDLATGRHQVIDQNAGRFSAGVPIATVSHQAGRGLQEDVFLVDKTGQILNYANAGGRWNGPTTVAAGFPPGAPDHCGNAPAWRKKSIAFGRRGCSRAGADLGANPRRLAGSSHQWGCTSARQSRGIHPGGGTHFTFRHRRGRRVERLGLSFGPLDAFGRQSRLSRRAPLVADPFSQTAFGVDATGRLIAGGYWDDAWHSHLLLPGIDYAPALVRRNIVANQGFKPAQVFFDNPSPEELVIQLVDPARGPTQFNIPPSGSVPQLIPRDGGGTLNEVYLVPDGFGGFVERVDSFPLPPQPGPTAVVWSKRVTYSYIDRKGISVVPDFDLKTHVSLGVFDLPPGEFLQDGDRFNVIAEAAVRRNPGAAQWFGLPAPDADIGVPLIRDYGQNPSQAPGSFNPPQANPTQPDPPRNATPIPPAPEESPPRNNEQPRQENPVLPPLPE